MYGIASTSDVFIVIHKLFVQSNNFTYPFFVQLFRVRLKQSVPYFRL